MKRSRASWCVALGVTGAVHGGLFWAIVTSGSDTPRRWVEPPVMELVSIRGGATKMGEAEPSPAAEKRTPPPAKPPMTAAFTEAKPSPPAPSLNRVASPQAVASTVPSDAGAPAAHSVSAAEVQAAATTPAPRSAPPAGAGDATGLNVDAPRGKSQDYAAMLRAWLEAHKTYPKHARMRREEGVVHVRFAVDRQGRLLDGAIVRSSGVASLDREALAMIDRSNPFPTAPQTVRGSRIELQTPVEFSLP